MWTYLLKKHTDEYLDQHPVLSDVFNQICLLETKDAWFLPRLMIDSFPSNRLMRYNGKKIVEPGKTNFKFTGVLRPNQVPIVETIFKYLSMNNHVNGIIRARPGIGKTVVAIYVAAQMGVKTCVIVDNTSLLEQWIKAIFDFTTLTENDIGIVKQKLTVTNKPVTIAMCQSLLSKIKGNIQSAFEFIDESQFGLVFYDEVHSTSSSEKFAKVSLLFRTKNILGLSATPFQTGSAEILMKNTIGEVIYETNEYDLKPRYYMVYYDSELGQRDGGKYSKRLLRVNDYIKRKALYNKIIVDSEVYLNLIGNYTKNLLKNEHRTIIICFTKKQVTSISERLTQFGVVNRRYYGEEQEIDKENDKVLVVTYSFCGKGFDMKSLSALIYATPLAGKKSLIQTCGRILRDYEGKRQPVVIDLVDMSFPFMSLKEVKKKTKIISDEFQIPIMEHREV